MKALFCTNYLQYTGAPLVLYDIVKGLKERGVVEPTVYSPQDGPLAADFAAIGVPVVNYVHWNFDLLYLSTIINYHFIAKAKAMNIPSYWAIHESDPNHFYGQQDVIGVLKSLRLPRKVIFQSHCTANGYGRYWNGSNFVVIPGAVDVPEGPTREEARKTLGLADEFTILTVGTIEKRKGQEDIAPCLENTGRSLRWFLVGHKAQDIPLDPRMVLVDPVKPKELETYYRAADLYVCTSRLESYPRSILQAIAYGLPIVTTPVFGIKEQVKGHFYRPGNTQELWERIENYQKPVEPVKHWSMAEMIDRYCSIISN
jgi:glycosyltransferase involved in cell wall biosynthesis